MIETKTAWYFYTTPMHANSCLSAWQKNVANKYLYYEKVKKSEQP
jgi:hypothetical protein